MTPVAGATVVVTGGQRGLGRALVQELLRRGAAKVYATARVPVRSDPPRVIPVPFDVTSGDHGLRRAKGGEGLHCQPRSRRRRTG